MALGEGTRRARGQRAGRRTGPTRHVGASALLSAGLLLAAAAASAETKPLWELGFAAGGGYLPDYPAAGQNHFNAIAVPYVVYRGTFIRAGDKGLVRGRFLKTEDLDVDISASGSFRADSADNDARQGMPDLDYLGEVGPRVQWTVARSRGGAKLDLELPVRAVFSTDLTNLHYRGVRAAPEIAYQHEAAFGTRLNLKLGLSADFGDEKLQDYFYQVDPQFAQAGRPAYDAKGGYLGSKLELSMLYPLNRQIRLFSLFQVDFNQGAANQDSPLFKDDVTYSVGVGAVVSLWQSMQQVRE